MGTTGHGFGTDLALGTRVGDPVRTGAQRMEPAAVREVARQFEAMFLREVLRDMRAGSLGEDVFGSSEGDLYQDMFDAQMASALSKGGGLGLARMLERQILEHAARTAPAGESATGAEEGAAAKDPAPAPGPAAAVPLEHPLERPRVQARDARRGTATAPVAGLGESAEAFVRELLPHARWAAAQLGVSPAAIIAQAALETAWGRRVPQTADGRPSWNLFGIKAGGPWRGASASASTLEYADGVAVRGRAAFRAYDSLEDGLRDYVNLLSGSTRFRQALDAGTDALAFVAGLARAGYATDPAYAEKLRAVLANPLLRAMSP
ncbi:MAG: flagellar assembly peptidoglycan hydrolase FlgJ [Steroidobacteraceae bacterium]